MKVLDIKRNKRGQFIRTWAKHRVQRKCLICGKEFETVESRIKSGKGKYCSRKCFDKSSRSKKTKLKMSLAKKGKRISPKTEFKRGDPRLCGKNNPNWNGGTSFEPYSVDWTKSLRKSIRERDRYTCQVCGEEPAVYVHHIDYDKKNCNPTNLVTLCASCHGKTNFNRKNWIKYFNQCVV